MRILIVFLGLTLVLAHLSADVTKGNFGGEKNTGKTPGEIPAAPKSKRTTYPFYGTLDSVDPEKKIITLRGKKKNRVILITAQTRIQKNGSQAKLEGGISGERVSGSVRKNAEGHEEAVTVQFGKKQTQPSDRH